MGNSAASSLLYEPGEKIPFAGSYWTLYNGRRKVGLILLQSTNFRLSFVQDANASKDSDDKDANLSIFTLNKATAFASVSVPNVVFPVANRCVQKMKTIKHPNMLTYVDSSITVPTASGNQPEQFIMLITEPVLPLYLWLERRLLNDIVLDVTNMQEEEIDKSAERINTQELQLLYNEILWGFKSTLTALQFLHEQVKVCHNCIGSDGNILINPINCTSIYVNRYTSEWKLCNLEFSNSLNTPSNKEDNDFITKYYPNMNILTSCNSNSLNSAQAVVVEGNIQRDIMALGNVMSKIYNYIEMIVCLWS